MLYSCVAGCQPSQGVPDMTVLSDIDEASVNENLKVRYEHDRIYVSFIWLHCNATCVLCTGL